MDYLAVAAKFATYVITIGAAVLTAILVFLVAAALVTAVRDERIVIEAFQVPKDLEDRGLTGQVIASKLMDRFKGLESLSDRVSNATELRVQPPEVPIKVQVSSTSISLDELYSYLSYWLANKTYVSGEITRTDTSAVVSYSLTARTNSGEPETCVASQHELDLRRNERQAGGEAAETDIEAQINLAAQCLFQFVEPERFAEYTAENGNKAAAQGLQHCNLASADELKQSFKAEAGDASKRQEAVETNRALLARASNPSERIRADHALGVLSALNHNYTDAIQYFRDELWRLPSPLSNCDISEAYFGLARAKFQLVVDSSADRAERGWAYYGLGVLARQEDNNPEAATYFGTSISIDSGIALAYRDLADVAGEMGHDQEQFEMTKRLISVLRSPLNTDLGEVERTERSYEYQAQLDDDLGNFSAAEPIEEQIVRSTENSGADGEHTTALQNQIEDLALDHDAIGVNALEQRSETTFEDEATKLLVYTGLGEWAAIVEECNRVIAESGSLDDKNVCTSDVGTAPLYYFAEAKVATEHNPVNATLLKSALAGLSTLPRDCYSCLETLASVEALVGDNKSSDLNFEQAIRTNPDIPFAYVSLGRALLRQNKVDLAIEQFQAGKDRGPAFADAWEAMGEALLRKSYRNAAMQNFAVATKLAPDWDELRVCRAEALHAAADEAPSFIKNSCTW